jgi:hypothetical protein
MGETDPNKVSYYKTQMANIIRYAFDIDVRRQIEKFFIDTFKDSEKMRGYLIEQYLNNNYPTENVEVITDSGIDFYKWIGGKHQEVSFIDFPSPADVTVESADLPSGLGTINQLNELKQTAKTTDQKIRQFYGLG